MHAPKILRAAIWYASHGIPVFPVHGTIGERCTCGDGACDDQGKHPATGRGLKDATTDLDRIKRFYAAHPNHNLAVTSDGSFWVLDVDGELGKQSLADLEAKHGPVQSPGSEIRASTPNKGLHLYFRGQPKEGVKNWIGVFPGLDVRSVGSYLVAPPSQIFGRPYSWHTLQPPHLWPEAPAWLSDEILAERQRKRDAKRQAQRRIVKPRPPGTSPDASIQRYVDRAIEDEIRDVEQAVRGERNQTLNRASYNLGGLIHTGAVDEEHIRAALLAAAEACGLPAQEAVKTIRSGLRAGINQPRHIEPKSPSGQPKPKSRPWPTDAPPPVAEHKEPPLAKQIDDLQPGALDALEPILAKLATKSPVEQDLYASRISNKVGVGKTAIKLQMRQRRVQQNDQDSPEREQLVTLAMSEGVDLFPARDGRRFCRLPSDRLVPCSPRSQGLIDWLGLRYHRQTGTIATSNALRDAAIALRAMAANEEPREVGRQILFHGGRLYIRKDHTQVIEIRPAPTGTSPQDCVRVIDCPPDIAFYRGDPCHADILPDPTPTPSSSCRDILGGMLPQLSPDGLFLVVGWLFGTLQPPAPYPILTIYGPKGSGKSILAQMLKECIDPEVAKKPEGEKRADVQDLIASIAPQHVHVADNLSYIDSEVSDFFCRVATGGNFSRRRLYTDGEKTSTYLLNPLILTSITEIARRADLLDRSIVVTLSQLGDRNSEAAIWQQLEASRADLLGNLCNAAAVALADLQNEPVPQARMADFARWVAAGSKTGWLGLSASGFWDAYQTNQLRAQEAIMDTDPVAEACLRLVSERASGVWEGSLTELHSALAEIVPRETKHSKGWPGSALALAHRFSRIAEVMRQTHGVSVDKTQANNKRLWTLRRLGTTFAGAQHGLL